MGMAPRKLKLVENSKEKADRPRAFDPKFPSTNWVYCPRIYTNLKNMWQPSTFSRKTGALFLWLFIILMASPIEHVLASDQILNDFPNSHYGDMLHFEHLPDILFVFGEIEDDDSFNFRKALRNNNIEIVVLVSPGGSVREGLQIAGIISDNRLVTYIPKGLPCLSACSFMFLAGTSTRYARGDLGVHQFYSDSRYSDTSETQYTVAEIIGFLNDFDTPPFVFEKMFSESEMYIFSESEKAKINSIASSDSKYLSKFADIDELLNALAGKVEEQQIASEDLANSEESNRDSQEKTIKNPKPQQGLDSLRSQYVLAIRRKIERNWVRPLERGSWQECEVHVVQGPGGIVLDVSFEACDGASSTYRASIENAIYRADPLPRPSDPSLFDKDIIFWFSSE